jgi:hypothetical protein
MVFAEIMFFELDESKIDKNTESWVHLVGKRNRPDTHYLSCGFYVAADAVIWRGVQFSRSAVEHNL